MALPRSIYALVSSLLFATGASAAPLYPVSARLTLAPRGEQRCMTLPSQATDCGILEQVRAAFDSRVHRMFSDSPRPNLELILEVKRAELFSAAGFQLDLAVRVRVLSPSGEPIDEIEAGGGASVLELQPGPIFAAGRAAAELAAGEFERRYAESTKISSYLVAGKIAPASAVTVRPRSDQLITLGLGLGFVQGGGDSGVALAPMLRASLAYRWFVVQASYSRFSPSFNPTQGGEASLDANDLALEAGVLYRLLPALDLRAGPGIHYLFGSVGDISPGPDFSKATPSLFASLSYSFVVAARAPRFTVGVEARGYLGSTVELPDLGRKVPLANSYFGAFLGIELPYGAKEGSAP